MDVRNLFFSIYPAIWLIEKSQWHMLIINNI